MRVWTKCTQFCGLESSLLGLGVFDKTPRSITGGETQSHLEKLRALGPYPLQIGT